MSRDSEGQHSARPAARIRADDWLTPGLLALLLFGFVLAMFPGVVFGTRAFFFRDYGIFSYPAVVYQRECFWQGEWPLWNPYNCCGIPFLAQWGTMTFYPLTLFYLLLPLPWSLGLFDLLHLCGGGVGMYLLAARWSGSRLGAAVAGMAFALNGMMLTSLMWPHYMVVLSWMPLVVLTGEDAWREGGRKVMLAGLAGTMQMLGGVPEIILLTWVVVIGLFLVERPGRAALGRLGLVVFLISGLAAVQLLPFFELLAHSNRDRNFADSTWAMSPWGWLNLVVPLFRCYETPLGVFFPLGQGFTSSYYLGIGPLALAILALRQGSNRRTKLLWVLAVLGLVLALGDRGLLHPVLRGIFPWIGIMRYPIKFIFLPAFALPLLASLALAAWSNPPPEMASQHRRWLITVTGALLATIAGVVLFAKSFPHPNEQWPAIWQSGLTRGLVLLLMTLILLKLQGTGERQHAGLCLALVVLAGVDAWTHTPLQNPTARSTVCQPGMVAEHLALKPMLGRCRAWKDPDTEHLLYFRILANPEADYIGRRFGLCGNCNMLDRISTPDGFFSLYLARQHQIAQTLYRAPTNRFPEGLANFAGIAYVTNPTNLVAWRTRTNALPLLTAGPQPVYLEPNATLMKIQAPDFDAQHLVYLPPEARLSISVTNGTEARILNQRFDTHRIVAEIEAKEPSLMVIAQSWYPCWRAYVDERPVPLWQANYAFQALEVPAGKHEVKLVYQDNTFIVGGLISLLTLGGMGAAWFKGQKPDLPAEAVDESVTTRS